MTGRPRKPADLPGRDRPVHDTDGPVRGVGGTGAARTGHPGQSRPLAGKRTDEQAADESPDRFEDDSDSDRD